MQAFGSSQFVIGSEDHNSDFPWNLSTKRGACSDLRKVNLKSGHVDMAALTFLQLVL